MMLSLAPRLLRSDAELLCIGAHSDDLEIGCSGTVFRLCSELPIKRVTWVVLSAASDERRLREARLGAEKVLGECIESRVIVAAFRDGFFPYPGAPVKEFFEGLKSEVAPDLILTHYRGDRHQDHRFVSELTYNTFRDHLILEYEIFKIDGDLGSPNVYVPLSEEVVERKVELLLATFGSQRDKRWFNAEAFRGLLRLRGVEAGAEEGYAEAFYGRKLVI
jgi:LmbE family N-acetylglucosaminyl deacetylase